MLGVSVKGEKALSKKEELTALSDRKIGEGNTENNRERGKEEDEKDDYEDNSMNLKDRVVILVPHEEQIFFCML